MIERRSSLDMLKLENSSRKSETRKQGERKKDS
jgi:hypothetical protein